MTDYPLTSSQVQRIRELGGNVHPSITFSSADMRESHFQSLIKELQRDNRALIQALAERPERNSVASMESTLAQTLIAQGFIEVKTPIVISSSGLTKMGIGEGHPLLDQVFWVSPKKCLRPMLAPNLYHIMRHLRRTVRPVRIFEIGPCFRKESKGSHHLEEFTMLNLVELAPEREPLEVLKDHARAVMEAVGLEYELVVRGSEVYGKTVDVEINGTELASGAVGPLPMDQAHGITEPWAGMGFGLERLIMLQGDRTNIRSIGRSLTYMSGARIDI